MDIFDQEPFKGPTRRGRFSEEDDDMKRRRATFEGLKAEHRMWVDLGITGDSCMSFATQQRFASFLDPQINELIAATSAVDTEAEGDEAGATPQDDAGAAQGNGERSCHTPPHLVLYVV